MLVLLLQLGAAVLFWHASLDPKALSLRTQPQVLLPFLVGIALFAGFVVFDEVLLVYRQLPSLETTHLVVLCALLLSLLLIRSFGEQG